MPLNIFFLLRRRVYLSKEIFLPRDICLIGVNQILETYIPLFIGTFFAIKNNVPCKLHWRVYANPSFSIVVETWA